MLKNNIDYIQTRSFLLANVNNIIENLNVRRRDKQNQSDDLFGVDSGNADPIQSTNWNFEYQRKSKLDILQEEKNSLGLYVSGNPLEGHADLLKLVRRELKTKSIHLVVVEKVKKIFTKHNSMMLALQITNHIERLEGIIFPTKADSFSPLLEEKKMYWIYGNIKQKNKLEDENEESNQYDQVPKLIVNGLAKAEQGPLVALSSAEADKADKTELLSKLNWNKLIQNPKLIQQLDSKQKPPAEILQNNPKTTLKLRKILGAKALTYIKETLSKKPLPDYLPVNIEAEISAGKFKQVKGEYWLHPKIIQKIKEVEKKMLAKSTG